MKTFVTALAVLGFTAVPTLAQEAPARTFAECAGRFSAEMEHAWLTSNPDAEHLEAQRATFVSLLDASVADNERQRSLSLRIEAKMAHAALLNLTTFGFRSERSDRAQQLAKRHITRCQSLLLGG